METKKPVTMESILDALDDEMDRRIAKDTEELAELATRLLTFPRFADPAMRTEFLAMTESRKRSVILELLDGLPWLGARGDLRVQIQLRYLRELGKHYIVILTRELERVAKDAETEVS